MPAHGVDVPNLHRTFVPVTNAFRGSMELPGDGAILATA